MSEHSSAVHNTPVIKKNQPGDNFKMLSLPAPTGPYPFHLNIDTIIDNVNQQKMVFHIVGDTGSLRNPCFTLPVANAMTEQCLTAELSEGPRFLFHLGDVVYNHGERTEYDRQFFIPYKDYPGPIVAIAGNHDSDVNREAEVPYKSGEPFVEVFCATTAAPVVFSGVKNRLSMTQPNIYWVLNTPLATFIGLHTNVPKFGIVLQEQRNWFVKQLTEADKLRNEKLLIVCMHHAPYSADTNHGSSFAMIDFLEEAFEETGVRPDIVFSGHVHNYQRFIKIAPGAGTCTYVVAGAGGYDALHPVATIDNAEFTNDDARLKNINLVSFCDNKHGFLKITIKKNSKRLQLKGEYFSLVNEQIMAATHETELKDEFTIEQPLF